MRFWACAGKMLAGMKVCVGGCLLRVFERMPQCLSLSPRKMYLLRNEAYGKLFFFFYRMVKSSGCFLRGCDGKASRHGEIHGASQACDEPHPSTQI